MKKLLLALLVISALSLSIAFPVFAVGDKVHGEKAEGPAYQNQETGLPDW